MKTLIPPLFQSGIFLGMALLPWFCQAYPPAPDHVLHGLVRDEAGQPLDLDTATVYLETTNGVSVRCSINPGIRPGENYRLAVPMDAGVLSIAYKYNALRATVPFRLKVRIGTAVYVPIEMVGDFSLLGLPAAETLMNLTLGEDTDGDGLPDAWERAMIAAAGLNMDIQDFTSGGDLDGDGKTNLEEFLAGTYAYQSDGNFKLNMQSVSGASAVIEFFALAGKTYDVLGTANLKTWTSLSVKVPAGDPNAAVAPNYPATQSQIVRLEVMLPAGQSPTYFFRIHAQ